MKINFTAISIFILAIAVFVSACIISNSLSNAFNLEVSASSEQRGNKLEKQLLSKKEASEYLGIPVEQFDELDRNQIVSFGIGIPFLATDRSKYYTIQAIEAWLSDTKHYISNVYSDF